MRSAEDVVNEYRERGYSIECLRVLADSRPEPLRSQMLAILQQLENDDAQEVACVAADTSDSVVLSYIEEPDLPVEDCIVEPDQPSAISFDDESEVVDILIGETDGSEVVQWHGDPPAMKEVTSASVWSRHHVIDSEQDEIQVMDQDMDHNTLSGMQPPCPFEMNDGIEPACGQDNATMDDVVQCAEDENRMDDVTEPVIMPVAAEEYPPADSSTEDVLSSLPVPASADYTPAVPGQTVPEPKAKEGRRKRRRKERSDRKKKKTAAKDAMASDAEESSEVREILMTKSQSWTPTPCDEQVEPAAPDQEQALLETLANDASLEVHEQEYILHDDPWHKSLTTVDGDLDTCNDPGLDDAPAMADDHLMIFSTGGLDLRNDDMEDGAVAQLHQDYQPEDFQAGNNVILFNTSYYTEFTDDTEAKEEMEQFEPVLRMLPASLEEPRQDDATEKDTLETVAAGGLTPMDQLGLLKALGGSCQEVDAAVDSIIEDGEHVILTLDPEAVTDDAARLAEEVGKVEQAYQEQIDDFTARMLEMQATVAATEQLAKQHREAAEAKDKRIRELARELHAALEQGKEEKTRLDALRREMEAGQDKLSTHEAVLAEHQRLYKEFEDLRRAYNEVVTDVMPGLQNERDDLALTVDRQCEVEETLRSSLGSARRRLAVGYSLTAAACLTMVMLPVARWAGSGSDTRDVALNRQEMSELRDRLDKAEMRNVEHEKVIFELEQKAGLQLAELEAKNRELNRLSDQRSMDMASLRSGRDAVVPAQPTRASTMALAGPASADGSLRVNEVRDPAGRIDQVVAANRANRQREASANDSRIAVSAVSSQRSAPALRPPANQRNSRNAPAARQARPDEVVAKVKQGEGVAQVVYRVLGTRNPEVISWVIRENNIKNDRRGNPRIYPDQELRLPKDGRLQQSASAARR